MDICFDFSSCVGFALVVFCIVSIVGLLVWYLVLVIVRCKSRWSAAQHKELKARVGEPGAGIALPAVV
jgi:hypothetical protein